MSKMWEISRVVGLTVLVGFSVEDIRSRQISGQMLWIGSVLSAGYELWTAHLSWVLFLSGCGIGVLFLGVSRVTREAIGYGDSMLITLLGSFVGAVELLEMLMIAWGSAGVFAMILLAKKQFKKSLAIPFVPFLTLGYAAVSISRYMVGI